MKITRLVTHLVELPLTQPISTAIHDIRSVGCVCLQLQTDVGLVGEAYVFTINAVRIKACNELIVGLAHQIAGRDPHYVEGIWEGIWSEINPSGQKGLTIFALAAVDTACWDLIGKAAEEPLHHLFGACRDKIKTYASDGLWLSCSIDELIAQAHGFIQQGFRAMKIRIGHQNIHTDVERVRAVREAIGPDTGLMADANQAFTPKHAVRLGHLLEEYDLTWLEEPVAAHDLRGHAEVRTRLHIPVASGETEYTRYGMKTYLDARACDILMPDLQRIGGLSEMRKVAALAAACNTPISTHIFTEHSLSIAGSTPGCMSVEHISWCAPLFNESLHIENGCITIPDRPGCGFSFNRETLRKYRM